MNSQLLLLCTLLSAIAYVCGHAVSIDPVPFNKNPDTRSLCGVAPGTESSYMRFAAGQTAPNTWIINANTKLFVSWRIVAADGQGPWTVKLDKSGNATFLDANTINLQLSDNRANAVQTFDAEITNTAAIVCEAPNGVCAVQISGSGWYSCAAVNITACDSCPAPTPAPPRQTTVGKLAFCTSRSNTVALLSPDDRPTNLDNNARDAYNLYLNKSTVFATPTTDCRTAYKQFLCAATFPLAPGASGEEPEGNACHGMCTDAMTKCGLTELHKDLYNCDVLPLCSNEKSAATSVAVAWIAVAAVIVAALF